MKLFVEQKFIKNVTEYLNTWKEIPSWKCPLFYDHSLACIQTILSQTGYMTQAIKSLFHKKMVTNQSINYSFNLPINQPIK